MAYGYLVEATYQSGYVLREDEQDRSPYEADRNVFHAILHKSAEQFHGPMVRFSLVGDDQRWDIDWTDLPDNARPIYYRKMECDFSITDGPSAPKATGHFFGYQFNDETGRNIQEVKEIH